MVSGNTDQTIRVATDGDTGAVRKIDETAFPADSVILQRAAPGELEGGIEAGDIHLLERRGRPLGYIYADRSREAVVYMSGIAVLPEAQGQGLGGRLVKHVLSELRPDLEKIPFVTLTSPFNTRMLRTLFRHGFVARWALPDYFGPQRHRFGFQLTNQPVLGPAAETCRVPSTALGTAFWLMEAHHFVVRALVNTSRGLHFDMAPTCNGDFIETLPPDLTSFGEIGA
jgi:ribosomal protein S18 acetylase RimI-like enzyme